MFDVMNKLPVNDSLYCNEYTLSNIETIRKCGISRLKLYGEFPTEHDSGAEKYQILICSPESLYKESVREQLLKLQKNIVRMAVNEAHCVLQL